MTAVVTRRSGQPARPRREAPVAGDPQRHRDRAASCCRSSSCSMPLALAASVYVVARGSSAVRLGVPHRRTSRRRARRGRAWAPRCTAPCSSPAPRPSWPCRSACSVASTSASTAANGFIARVLRFFAEVMTGVPSIVMGLFVYTAVVLQTKNLNAFAGALALGVPDAADRHPHDRRDAPARARRAPRRAAPRSGAARPARSCASCSRPRRRAS